MCRSTSVALAAGHLGRPVALHDGQIESEARSTFEHVHDPAAAAVVYALVKRAAVVGIPHVAVSMANWSWRCGRRRRCFRCSSASSSSSIRNTGSCSSSGRLLSK